MPRPSASAASASTRCCNRSAPSASATSCCTMPAPGRSPRKKRSPGSARGSIVSARRSTRPPEAAPDRSNLAFFCCVISPRFRLKAILSAPGRSWSAMATDTKQITRPRTPMSQAELDEVVRRHDMYLSARLGGQRALLAYRDLSGLDLAGKRLSDADLTAAFLPAARMAGANLANANLFGCELVRADLRGAVLRGADLEGADLFDADLRDGRLGHRLRIGVIEEVAIANAA